MKKSFYTRGALGLSRNGLINHLDLTDMLFRGSVYGHELGMRESPLPVSSRHNLAGVCVGVLNDDEAKLAEKYRAFRTMKESLGHRPQQKNGSPELYVEVERGQAVPVVYPGKMENRILAALPRAEYERLLPNLEPVQLKKGRILSEADDETQHVYFLNGGMASLLSITEDGKTLEVAMVCNEGLVGIETVLKTRVTPYRTMVEMPGEGFRIKAAALNAEFDRGGVLQKLLLRYTHALMTQLTQSALCNSFHSVDRRLSRWLLHARDCMKASSFQLTQEYASHMLGAPRTGISRAASSLQSANLIRYNRGQITIVDERGLEKAACECYRNVTEANRQFLAGA